jgi:magnesium transporter
MAGRATWERMLRGVTPEPSEPTVSILVRHPDGPVTSMLADRLGDLDSLAADDGTLLWVHLWRPTDETIDRIGSEFGIHQLALEDLRKQGQRPKIDSYDAEQHVVAYEAAPGARNGVAELQLLIGSRWVVSAHWDPTPMVDALHLRVGRGGADLAETTTGLVYLIMDAAVDSFFPELDAVSERIDALEDEVIEARPDPRTLREILQLKRQLLEQRRVLAPMRDVANALLRGDGGIVERAMFPYYQNLYDHLVRVLDQLDLYRDLLAAVLDARLSSVSNELNATMRRLTAVTVVIMVPTLIAGIYGMNFAFMPELDWRWGYPFALAVMAMSIAGTIVFFRRRDWI